MSKVDKLRLKVTRAWGQISVKDFETQDYSNLSKYAKETWKDIVKIHVKVCRGD